MAPRIAGILLDIGETLLTYGKVNVPALFREGSRMVYRRLQEWGHRLPRFGWYHRRELLAVRWAYIKGHFSRREFDALELLRKLHLRLGIDLSREQALELSGLWYEPLSRAAVVEEGAREVLGELRGRGLTLGTVSNTFIPAPILDRHLERERLIEFLPVRVYSCQTVHRKPDRRIFEAALAQAHLAAQNTLFVGDSILADICGANNAGLISVLKDPAGRKWRWPFRPQHRIARLADLLAVVEQYNASR